MNARSYACDVLYRVIYEGGYASLLMRKMPDSFSAEDRSLITEIVYGTLRNLSLLEYQWKDLAHGRVRRNTAVLLNLSVYQLQYMDRIPSYAVINEAAEAAAKRDRGFVNAVLRNVAKRGKIVPEGDWPKRESILYSHPEFLLRMWEKQYGKDIAEQIAIYDQTRPKIYGRINTLKLDNDIRSLPEVTMLEGDCFTYEGNLVNTPWLKDGTILIQSRTSQHVIRSLDVKPGIKVLDVCAAPGTKTQQIACAMQNQGSIKAGDVYEERVGLISQLMERTGVSIVEASVRDAAEVHEEDIGKYDRVLADVPCSGLGDLSHKPEIRFHVTPQMLDEIVALQETILKESARCLKTGGILVYSTCTLNRKENEGQVRKFLAADPDYELLEERTLFPFEEDSDGFYFAKIIRKA